MKKKTKLLILAILLPIVAFGLYHLFWRTVVFTKYEEFRLVREFQEVNPGVSYLLVDNGVIYNVEFPFYLSLTGNLGIQANEGNFVLLIWPRVFGETIFGIMIIDEENGQWYDIELDENRNVLDEGLLPVYEENIEMIDYLFNRAYAMWGIYSH